jgi:hypothetical protein
MDWIIETVFFLKAIDDKRIDKSTSTDDKRINKNTPPIDDKRINKSTPIDKKMNTNHPPWWCTCRTISNRFGKFLRCGSCKNTIGKHNFFLKLSYCCCECDFGDGDLKNKKLPHHHHLNVQKGDGQWYCGCFKLNMNRIGIYLILCACVWCASLAFFEGVILAYASVKTGDSCPIPKRGTPATIVDCFIFATLFDTSPINKTFSTQCNGTVQLSFNGDRAGCFA